MPVFWHPVWWNHGRVYQLSVIVRLDRSYEIVERFLTFSNVSRDCTALGIGEVVKATLSKFGASVKSKLIMQNMMVLLSWVVSSVTCRHVFAKITLLPFFIVLPIGSILFCARLPKLLSRLSGFFLKSTLFVHFPHLVLTGRHLLLQKVLIYLVQVKLDGSISPEQFLLSLSSLKLTWIFYWNSR